MAVLFDGVLYLLRDTATNDKTTPADNSWLASSCASGLQGSLTASGVEFCFIWPCLNGGYFLFNRNGRIITPFMDTDSDTERANPGDNSEE